MNPENLKYGRWLLQNAEIVKAGKFRLWQYKGERYNNLAMYSIYHKEMLKIKKAELTGIVE